MCTESRLSFCMNGDLEAVSTREQLSGFTEWTDKHTLEAYIQVYKVGAPKQSGSVLFQTPSVDSATLSPYTAENNRRLSVKQNYRREQRILLVFFVHNIFSFLSPWKELHFGWFNPTDSSHLSKNPFVFDFLCYWLLWLTIKSRDSFSQFIILVFCLHLSLVCRYVGHYKLWMLMHLFLFSLFYTLFILVIALCYFPLSHLFAIKIGI